MKLDRLHALYHQPLFDLISQSREIHLEHWRGEEVQRCSLLSIKTGGCEARKLKAAGVTAYNHNIDTSPEFYPEVVSTHTFQDRLKTIAAVQASGMSVCSGGIIGMGESENDRLRLIEVLSNFDPPPESVPINCLIQQNGTPFGERSEAEISARRVMKVI